VSQWNAPTDFGTVCRRAGGRKRYNAMRKAAKQWRRIQIISMTAGMNRRKWGLRKRLAAELGVSVRTISEDFKAIRNADRGALLE
jgi:hypothetical protein